MLQARRLEKIIDNRNALSIEQLDLNPGDIMTVVGLVGSGKTLLIRLLSGMLVPSGGKVLLDGQDVQLTPTEYDLLKVFIAHRGKILTRQMLLKEIWGSGTHARTHSLHVYVAQLRRKIEPNPEDPRFILTIPGVGYRFNEESE